MRYDGEHMCSPLHYRLPDTTQATTPDTSWILTLEWAHPLMLDAETCEAAACALPVLQWLRRLNVPWDATTAAATLRHGYEGTRRATGYDTHIEDVPADGVVAFEWALANLWRASQ